MRIVTVTYRELRSAPGFNHLAIEVTASVEPDETPEIALERAKWWVRNQHHEHAAWDKSTILLKQTRDQYEQEVEILARKRNALITSFKLVTRWRVWRAELRGYWRYYVLGKLFRARAYRESPDEFDDVPF